MCQDGPAPREGRDPSRGGQNAVAGHQQLPAGIPGAEGVAATPGLAAG
jgi:hypothetical protein